MKYICLGSFSAIHVYPDRDAIHVIKTGHAFKISLLYFWTDNLKWHRFNTSLAFH